MAESGLPHDIEKVLFADRPGPRGPTREQRARLRERGWLRSLPEIAGYLGMAPRVAKRLLAEGLPVRKVSNFYLTHVDLVDDWLRDYIRAARQTDG